MKWHAAVNRIMERRRNRACLLRDKGLFSSLSGSGGYVLIMVSLMVALLVTMSGEFIVMTQTDIQYLRKCDYRLKAATLAKSGMNLAIYILEADKRGIGGGILPGRNTDKSIDTWQDLWALEFPPIPFDEGMLTLRITDENAKINLSVLANEVVDKTPYYGITQRFFLNMGLPMDFADIVIDWVDIDDTRFAYGAESGDYYLTLPYSYSARNDAFDSIDDMLLLKDMTPEIFYGMGGGNAGLETGLVDNNHGMTELNMDTIEQLVSAEGGSPEEIPAAPDDKEKFERPVGKEKSRRLSDYLRVYGKRQDYLDELNKININTASFRVISALTDNMSDDIVSEIIRRRTVKPFKTVDEIKDLITDDIVRKNILTVQSSIFRIESIVEYRDTTVRITGIYNRNTKKYYYWCQY